MRNKKTLMISVIIISFMLILSIYQTYFSNTLNFPEEINLASIKLSDKPIFSFELTNKGNKNIEVARIYTSCGCTSVINPVTGFEVKSKESKKITIQFDPSSMHKKGDDVYHEIYIFTSKPTEKEYVVKMKGNIL
jgi:hypothetical protein